MILTVVLTAIFFLLANVAVLFYVKRRLTLGLLSYLAARGDRPSEFAELVGVILDQAAAKNAQSLKGVFMGQNSVASKNAGKLDQAVTADMIGQQSPMLGMAMSAFPNLSKLVTKNPGALDMLASLIKGQGKGDGSDPQQQLGPENGEGKAHTLFSL